MSAYKGRPFRLSKIRIQNVRSLEDLTINLTTKHGTRNWAVIFGDNGVGKTTLLRCIAMGLCDQDSAAGLLREIYGDWHTKKEGPTQESVIELSFRSPKGSAVVTTRIIPKSSGYSRVVQSARLNGLKNEEFPWDGIFACGYGAARRSFGTRDIGEYATVDSVYTLFNYDTPLQNPELVIRRLLGKAKSGQPKSRTRASTSKKFLDGIASILMLKPNSIKLTDRGLTVTGEWGDFHPIGGLGDGFQATLSWLTDFVGWALLYDKEVARGKKVRGIVLLDEIEQHLHPRWQREIIKLLHDQFPDVQFIVTTHTPMCAVGTTDLSPEECELIKLARTPHGVVAEQLEQPRGKRADQVLTSQLFDLPTTVDDRTLTRIVRFNQLMVKAVLNRAEKRDLSSLKADLERDLGKEESEFETVVRTEVRRALAKVSQANINSAAADAEVRRIFREMRENEKNRIHRTE